METNLRDATPSQSQTLFQQARKVIPGGVTRGMVRRQPHPDYVDRAEGCRVIGLDGKTWIDFSNNTASLIHGHAHPQIVRAVARQLGRGSAYSMACESELRFAEHLCGRNRCFEQVRFMNSGTEALMATIKVARAITGRNKIAKAEGAYHGTGDDAQVSQHSSPSDWGPSSQPVSVAETGSAKRAAEDVVAFPFNDTVSTLAILERHKDDLACVLLDPLPHRLGLVPADTEFVEAIRQWTLKNKSLLAFDEVMSFRMQHGGAQAWYPGVAPDLTALGKIIGGGFPVGAVAGKAEYMSRFYRSKGEPLLSFSGTFSANPITMTAGLVALEHFDEQAVAAINALGDYARKEIAEAIETAGVSACVTGAGSMFRIYLKPKPPSAYRSAWQSPEELRRTSRLVDYLYAQGFLLINTCTAALASVHTKAEIDQLVEAIETGLIQLADH